jgi:ribosome biogenesis GTPase / thiamine phosphate phosphatase
MNAEVKEGVVIKTTGSWYAVRLEDGEILQSRIVGKFRLDGKSLTNPVAVGDEVKLSIDKETGDATIVKIKSRRNYVIRQSPRKKHDLHLIASNIDQAVLLVTITQPNLKQGFIDRFILTTEPHNIPVHIIFNKADLYEEEDFAMYLGLQDIYDPIGYKTHLVSALTGHGVDEIRELLKGKITLTGGQSGVGKSTLINTLQPDLDLKTAILSDHTGKGQHTTTFAEMFPLDFGGYIIDIPGIKTLSFNNLEPMDVSHNFREFFELSSGCKFPNCTHRNEPHCAIHAAIEDGSISELRYLNYIKILEELEEQNYWERHKHF